MSISKYGSDTPVTRPETDKAGLSSRDRNTEDIFIIFYMEWQLPSLCSASRVPAGGDSVVVSPAEDGVYARLGYAPPHSLNERV